eukprot:TRINITY_DN19363_c0_g1_i1.p1 TRINITY_DN19363_c0_g1~~TRINITY_DN19363_c0_g1_i1.p1  ORF type:complete len:442 (+),score=92.43 TRINITY_DN19363_c0_g1_i1:42-1367(+)
MATLRVCLLALCLHGAASDAFGATVDGVRFKKLVLLSRHGIRTPYPADGVGQVTYSAFSKDGRAWPEHPAEWGAAGAEHLTAHGATVLHRMGDYYRRTLPFNVSAASSTVYADYDSSQRDVQTAQNFFKGLGLAPAVYSNLTCTQLLFNQGAAPPAPQCTLPSQAMVEGTLGGSIDKYTAQYRDVLLQVSDAIDCCTPSVCGNTSSDCDLTKVPTSFNSKAFWSLFTGPLSTAAALTEFLSLMYQNGMDVSTVAPGLDPYTLSRLMEVHALSLRVTDGNLITARSFASQLMNHISRTVAQLTGTGSPDPWLRARPSDNLVYYAGHDLNLYFIRDLLDLQWQTESYNQDMAPPGSMLGFQLLQDASDAWFVKLYVHTQSMDQMRQAAHLDDSNPPDRAPIVIPRCYHGPGLSCAVDDFIALVASVVKPECLTPQQFPAPYKC